MNKKNKTGTILVAISFGLVTGFVSLILASILELLFSQEKLSTVFLFVFLEEMLKLGAIYLLFQYGLFSPRNLISILLIGLGIGFGFSVFEAILIFLKLGNIPIEVLRPTAIHVTTSLLLAWSMRSVKKESFSFPALPPILFAVILHLCYNIFVIIGI